jgi:hypothetical protein
MVSNLESHFGHIVERMLKCWGQPAEFNAMYNDLVFDTRADRSGWPEDVWKEIEFLNALHKRIFEMQEEVVSEPVDDDIKWVS